MSRHEYQCIKGHKVDYEDLYCRKCGARLEDVIVKRVLEIDFYLGDKTLTIKGVKHLDKIPSRY